MQSTMNGLWFRPTAPASVATCVIRSPARIASETSSIVYANTRYNATLNAISGPTMCFACAYWPPAAATVDVTSESIIATHVYSNPTNQQTTSAASAPPLSAEKFQPVNSPTSTMPTPSAQMCAGPSTRSSETLWPCSLTAIAS